MPPKPGRTTHTRGSDAPTITTDTAYETAGRTPQIVVERAEMDAVLRFVERGIGVAIVPAMVLLERQGLRSVRLTHPTLTRTISIARVAGLAPTAAVEVMEQTIVRTATALAARPDAFCAPSALPP